MEQFKESIIKIQQRDNIWKEVEKNEFEFKVLELKKGKPTLHLVFDNDITFRLIYKCNNCFKESETSWFKFFIQQIKKNKCLCQKCSAGTKENRKKISERTKEAMAKENSKQNQSNAQKKRFERKEEREKASIRSKEIMKREGMKELISTNTKKSMSKIDTKTVCNPHKYMTEEEIVLFNSKIGKSVSQNYSLETYEKYLKTYKETMRNEDSQWNIINGIRKTILKKRSNLQQFVNNYLKNHLKLDLEEEYPINLYHLGLKYKFILIDIAIPKEKIAIEVMGNYYHDGFAEYLSGFSESEIRLKYAGNDFVLNRFEKDLFDYNYYKNNDWKILYLTQNQILNDDWISILNEFLLQNNIK